MTRNKNSSWVESSVAGEVFFATEVDPNAPTADETGNARHVKLASEYGTSAPIWNEDGLLDSDDLISAQLEAEITEWSDQFDELYDPETGWANFTMCTAHYTEGTRLHQRLIAELGDTWIVDFEFWQLLIAGNEVSLSRVEVQES